MNFGSLFKKVAPLAASFIPGVGPMASAVVGGLVSNQQAKAQNRRSAANDRFNYDRAKADNMAAYAVERADALADRADNKAQERAIYDRTRADALGDEADKFVRLRAAAEAGGFNPLSVLGLSGSTAGTSGAGASPLGAVPVGTANLTRGTPIAPLSSVGMLANGLLAAAEEFTPERRQEREQKALQLDMARIELDQMRANAIAPKPGRAAPVKTVDPAPLTVTGGRPVRRPSVFDNGSVTVFLPDGVSTTQVPAGAARRLKLEEYDVLVAEDFEAIFGDEVGQAILLPQIPNIGRTVLGGTVSAGSSVEKRRDTSLKQGFSMPLNNQPSGMSSGEPRYMK